MMARLTKIVLILIAGVVGFFVLGAVALTLFFEPNDFREDLSRQVFEATGRELRIEGDLSISVFPWLAVEIGPTTLGNAAGFGEEPFVSFDLASLSIELMPLLLHQKLSVGTISLDGFEARLAVARDGTTNWNDPGSTDSSATTRESTPAETAQSFGIASVHLSNGSIHYANAQSGSRYTLTQVNADTGRIAAGEPFELDANFEFATLPGDLGGALSIRAGITLAESLQQLSVEGLKISGELTGIGRQATSLNLESRAIELDMAGQTLAFGELDLDILGLSMSARIAPFSYAADPAITASLRVADFSLKELLPRLDIEAPVTADPNALTTVSFSGDAQIGATAMALHDMTLVLDNTTMTGELAVPLVENGFLTFDLRADRINLDNYMAPADAAATGTRGEVTTDFEIPVALIRALNARGSLQLDEAFLGPMTFTRLQMGVNGEDDVLRLHPITATFFEGTYNGDVLIDATGSAPSLSVNERISDVNLQAMAKTVFAADNISGTINGSFVLSGHGRNMTQIRQDLDGTMAFELAEGTVEGTDIWYRLRSARAKYKREDPPEPTLPPRTEFSAIKVSGTVTDGIFSNDELLFEMPFLRITGKGTIDLGDTGIDYSVQARVLEKPEFVSDVTEDELADFTEALIPIRVRGTLASPKFSPDIEAMFRREVEEVLEKKADKLKNRLLRRLQRRQKRPVPATATEERIDAEPTGEKKIEEQ